MIVNQIDEQYYTKKSWKEQVELNGQVAYYLGVMDFYLDYQVWQPRFRFWHPITWCFVIGALIIGGLSAWPDIKEEFKKYNKKYKYTLSGAK